MTVHEVLTRNAAEILAEAGKAVACSRLRHYNDAGNEEISRRLKALFDLTVESVANRDVGPMIAHAEKIARERYDAGFDLSEVQTAFNVLEESMWKQILKHIAPEDYAEALGLVSTALGQGKDALARFYVELASRTKAPSLNLQSLFSGTAGV
jgi:hypothetical protein